MTTQSTFNGQDIINVLSVSKWQAGYGQWTLRAEFQTADGEWHKLSAHITNARLIDEWQDAIADDDMIALHDVKSDALNYILDKQ